MAICTFKEAMEHLMVFILRPGCKNENRGYWSDIRVDRTTLPEGWFAYDIREGDSGGLATIEKGYVFVNHAATFLTQKEIIFPKGRNFIYLCGRGGYTFE